MITAEIIRQALHFVPANDRDLWVRMGMAVKSALDEDGFDIWDEWSQRDGSYNEADARTVWRSLKSNGKVSIGTLFHEAKARGWQNPMNGTSQPGHGAHKSAPAMPTHTPPAKSAHKPGKPVLAAWDSFVSADSTHPYIVAKRGLPDGLRVVPIDDELTVAGQSVAGWLVVPALSLDNELHTLQLIAPPDVAARRKAKGLPSKLNFPGASFGDGLFVVGDIAESAQVCVVEGIGQAWACWRAKGHAAVVCFGSARMASIAEILHGSHFTLPLVVVADRGKEKQAEEIARTVGGKWVALPGDKPENYDANDYAAEHGADELGELLDKSKTPTENSDIIEWPDPRPITAELKPVPTFDANTLLPEVLRAWIMDEAERMPCAPEFIASAVLVALGSIIGARFAIKPKAHDSWQIVPNLWGGVVGDPSAKKSPACGVGLKPLDRLMAKAREAHTTAIADYETEKVVFEAQKEAIEGRIKAEAKKGSNGDPISAARELRAHGEQAPDEPTLRRYKTNDCTVEKLGELLRENPTGLLVLRDELVGLIATWEREGREGERAFFLEGWNGNQGFDTDRIGRGHISIPNVCVSIFGGIQPDKLTVYLEQAAHALANDGMLQRFQMLVYPDTQRWEWRDRAPDKVARDAAFEVFETLADMDPVALGATAADDFVKFPYFCFDEEAQVVFIEWSEDMHQVRMPNEDEPIIRQHLAKFDKLFPALALIFHLVDCAADGVRGPISKEAALRAAAWCEFLEAHARRCYGLLKDDGLRAAQALAAKLERGALDDGFTLRDVRRHQWRNLTKDDAIQAALDWLEDEDWLRSKETGGTGPGGGRRTLRYSIHPTIKAKRKGNGA